MFPFEATLPFAGIGPGQIIRLLRPFKPSRRQGLVPLVVKDVGIAAPERLGQAPLLVLYHKPFLEAMHAAEIVSCVQEASSSPGFSGSSTSSGVTADSGNPVPIIESRVTRSASAASLMPSVPGGRRGKTR